ncbi:carboxylesteras-like protein [Massariosphaeria phaeospora]|uniref:Carboxylesteras-like protein n=1 Tax=Massariosphaeria phaeospora TaxID=100035 RepID=A0A7C8I656_9PLEO|nr:carboxylesteras-like protein [Massariosphaeria phaeospora]
MTNTLKTSFGEFKGKKTDGVIQYLGVQYATLKNQLAVPEIVERYESPVDATQYGPRAVSFDGCEFEQNFLIQQNLPIPTVAMSGLDCLNLNILVPDIEITDPLPVMVFIHGGGFIMGSNHWPQYDPTRLVKLSGEHGLPVLGVSINYRLGVLGNLTSKELRQAGYPGNNSLRDQACAMKWIKSSIREFGGNPDNITAFGESAGAVSVLHQLDSEEPLFQRAISMAGTPLMLKPLSLPRTEMTYGVIMEALGLETASAEDRIQRLLTITPDELVAKTPMAVPLGPFLDGDIIPSMTTFKALGDSSQNLESVAPGRQWCTELMIGDCKHDVCLLSEHSRRWLTTDTGELASAFITSLTENLSSQSSTEAVLHAYNITPLTSDDAARQSLIEFASDIAFHAPVVAFAQSWPGRTYCYNFNEPNPWDGPFKGDSTHVLDAAFLFQNFNEKLDPRAREVAVELAKSFIEFANGGAPWQEYDKETGGVMAFGPSEKQVKRLVDRNGWGNERRDVLFKLKEEGKIDLDELSVAWDSFIARK